MRAACVWRVVGSSNVRNMLNAEENEAHGVRWWRMTPSRPHLGAGPVCRQARLFFKKEQKEQQMSGVDRRHCQRHSSTVLRLGSTQSDPRDESDGAASWRGSPLTDDDRIIHNASSPVSSSHFLSHLTEQPPERRTRKHCQDLV